MNKMYAMQRANGDWFVVKDHGRLRVPVFQSRSEAIEARARNSAMMLFKPVGLDEDALNDLAPTDTENGLCFWLVTDTSITLSQGRPMEFAPLALLVRDTRDQTRVATEV
jgi:hypothetical protein